MRIGADTCVLLDQANGVESVLDALQTIRERAGNISLFITETVLDELHHFSQQQGPLRAAATRALVNFTSWGYSAIVLDPTAWDAVDELARKLSNSGALPETELNDADIITEAVHAGFDVLLSSDAHMRDAQTHPAFRRVLLDSGMAGWNLVIASPGLIAQRFRLR